MNSIPEKMKAAAIDRFGGPEVIHIESLPVPKPTAGQVLIQVDVCGVGAWDPEVREGEVDLGQGFPLVMGNDGAGTIAAVGKGVTRFAVGDRVYAYTMSGGFYAEYVAVEEDNVAPIPSGLALDEAGALGADRVTALRGLEDELELERGERLMIYGANGGIGHLALQLARRMGAKVLAVASGSDGVKLVERLGAEAAVDGRRDDVAAAARGFAPGGLDAALVLTAGDGLAEALKTVKKGGRVAYPNGVDPEPRVPAGIESLAYDGTPSPDRFERLNELIAPEPFHVELGHVYPLEDAARAHREVAQHHLGKLALRVHA